MNIIEPSKRMASCQRTVKTLGSIQSLDYWTGLDWTGLDWTGS